MYTVIGAQGFVGSHLARYLAGARRIAPFTPEKGSPALFSRPLGHVFYCAGLTNDFLQRPFDTVEAHVTLFARLLKEAAFDSMTYLSSTRLYDSGGPTGNEEDTLELNPNEPRHLYDLSKALGENLCQTAGRKNVRAVRLACVYADDLEADIFLHRVILAAKQGGPLKMGVSPDSARDYIHVDDVLPILLAIAERGRRPLYNLASGANVSNAELFKLLFRLTGWQLEATQPPSGDPTPVIDIQAILEDFAIRPKFLGDRLPGMLRQKPTLGAA
ncbi:NAD-dependent epimerase/dehydratase [Hypericibacter adhaerens]|uniref:NAD-dependent epimerase/dehydratase n=1 Tax=Hypericibacter adhaerens TaxID=2602016 RepID=A0A5J6N2K1_9PROT|nr:SDR family oxidoreductase [Hypericibacter adhaerens]QEX23544.1 NAD-dependent epimerase/dehydratase [Hypericibacter adhaerens]